MGFAHCIKASYACLYTILHELNWIVRNNVARIYIRSSKMLRIFLIFVNPPSLCSVKLEGTKQYSSDLPLESKLAAPI